MTASDRSALSSLRAGLLRAAHLGKTPPPVVSVVELYGAIGAGGRGGPGRGLSHAGVLPMLEAAFRPDRVVAVALAVNSPGGSPVQSRLIHQSIRRLAASKGKPVLAFAEDVAASGGYILALAADEIYADASSIVGSIGVISSGFGLHEAIRRYGVERRVHASADAKSQLDPFRPERPEDVARLQATLDALHAQFADLVKDRRGARLKDPGDVFSGAFWAAPAALERGLVDGTAHLDDFLRARYGEDVKLRRLSPAGSPLRRLLGGRLSGAAAGKAGPDATGGVADLAATLADEALWSRYGL